MEMRLKNLYGILLCLIALQVVRAQNVTIVGTIKDGQGDPVFGANVMIKGTTRGTATDEKGAYKIQAQVGEILHFFFLGMKEVEKKVTAKTSVLDIVLQDDVQEIDTGLVFTGYGAPKVGSRTVASVAQIQGKEIADVPTANISDALQGRVAGLIVSARNGSGRAGGSNDIVIHGYNNFQELFLRNRPSSAPLIIMDGVAVGANVLSDFNSNDIESITILKDAASTSIYGSRAANGVILITTKRGKNNERTNITINHQLGFSALTNANRKFFEGLMTSQEYMDFWIARDPAAVRSAAGITGTTEADNRAAVNKILSENPYNTRWDKIFFRDFVPITQTNVSISGGSNSTAYYLSFGYFNQEGTTYPADNYKRYTLSGSVDTQIKSWLKAGVSFSVGHNEREGSSEDTNYGLRTTVLPLYTPKNPDGTEKEYISNITRRPMMGFYHPNYYAKKHPSNSLSDDFLPTAYVMIEPIKNLIFKTQGGIQYSYGGSESKELPSFINYRQPTPSPTTMSYNRTGTSRGLGKTFTNTLQYRFLLGTEHSFDALIGQESIENVETNLDVMTYHQPSDGLSMLVHGNNESAEIGDGKEVQTFNSFFARLEYNYSSRYFLDLSARRDGSSAFGRNNQYANFWAVGAMWKLKKEKFLENIKWLTDLNLRFSTGFSGNAAGGGYRHLTTIGFDSYYNRQIGYEIKTLGNPNLHWEKQRKTTVGLNIVLDRATSFNIEYYDRETYEMLSSRSINTTSGREQFFDNAGGFRNRGVDFTFSSVVYKNEANNFSIRPYFNVNYNNQELTALFGKETSKATTSGIGYKLGRALEWTAVISKGIDPTTGVAQYYVPGEDRMEQRTDDNDLATANSGNDLEKLVQTTGKKLQAPINGGFGWDINYKSFSLNMAFAFSWGRYMQNLDMVNIENPRSFGYANLSRQILDYWKKPGDVTRHPKIDTPTFVYNLDDRLIQKADFVRLKSITLSYRLSKEVLDQIKFFDGLRFYLTARNIFTITPYQGADPEMPAAISAGGYPPSRQFTFGVELSF